MKYQHQKLAAGKWQQLSFPAQMANIGAEVGRTINWREKNNDKYSRLAFFRALELLDLTIADQKNIRRLKELIRLREVLADYFYFDNIYQSSDQKWQTYFNGFNYKYFLNK
jgi:hypothetical protein